MLEGGREGVGGRRERGRERKGGSRGKVEGGRERKGGSGRREGYKRTLLPEVELT